MSVCSDDSDDSTISYMADVARHNGIRETMWCADRVDMYENHPFTVCYVSLSAYNIQHKLLTFRSLIRGPRWIDVWKAIDTCYKKIRDDHVFIEILEQKGHCVEVFLGS